MNPSTAPNPAKQLWGGETAKAVENFPVSDQPVPVPVLRWLGRLKAAAARVTASSASSTPARGGIADAGDAVAGANTTISSRSTSSRPAPAPPRT
jgi:fumarate hydratase class II